MVPRAIHQGDVMARVIRCCCTLLALLIVGALDLTAQQSLPAPGDRVRLTLSPHAAAQFGVERMDASLRAADSASITLQATDSAGLLVLASGDVVKFERFAGRKSHIEFGAVIGVLTGAIVGYAVTYDPLYCHAYSGLFGDVECTGGEGSGVGLVVGGLVGALIGGVSGSRVFSERWMTTARPVQVSPAVIRGVPGMAMRVAF